MATAGPDDPRRNGSWDDPAAAVSFGNYAIILTLCAILAWAFWAPIDEGIPAPGVVAVESRHKTITHLGGGVIRSVHVSENQNVSAGEVLITFDDTQQRTRLEAAEKEYFAAAIKLARLETEQAQAKEFACPDPLKPYLERDWGKSIFEAQENLFRTRQRTFDSEQAILRENLAAAQGMVRGTRQQIDARQRQIGLLKEEIGGLKPMVQDGYSPRNKLLEQERQLSEVTSVAGELQANLARGVGAVSEIRLRQLQREQERLRDIDSQITDSRRDVALLGEKLTAARDDLARTQIRAPVSGQAVRLEGLISGGSIVPASRLLDLIPKGDRLLVDARVPTHVGNRLQAGLIADIRIAAFPEDPQLVVEGKVLSVSIDRHIETADGAAYYLARVQVTDNGLQRLGRRQLLAGMSVDVVIKTGERSLIAYLMKPLTRRLFGSLNET